MILKNIKPYPASQLRSRVNTVDELVKLGFQLKKDHAQQLYYERRITTPPTPPQRLTSNRPAGKPPVQCWRCKVQHPPGNCPLYSCLQSTQSSSQHPSAGNKRFFQPQKQGVPPSNNALSITPPSKSSNKSASKFVSIPQQLIVPINIGAWRGKAIWILEEVTPFSMRVCGRKLIPLPASILGPLVHSILPMEKPKCL